MSHLGRGEGIGESLGTTFTDLKVTYLRALLLLLTRSDHNICQMNVIIIAMNPDLVLIRLFFNLENSATQANLVSRDFG